MQQLETRTRPQLACMGRTALRLWKEGLVFASAALAVAGSVAIAGLHIEARKPSAADLPFERVGDIEGLPDAAESLCSDKASGSIIAQRAPASL